MSQTILLIGQTGSGKSTLGNWLIGEEVFDTSNYTSETFIKQSRKYGSINIIDTPGLSDSEGKDQENTKKMTEFLKNLYDNKNSINLVLVVIKSDNKRFDDKIKRMILFLCNVFPKHLQYNIGITFTFYNYEKELEKQIYKEDYVPEIMKIISHENNEEINLNPPIFFLDSKKKDKYSMTEIQRLIFFTRTLPLIQSINVCDSKFKKFETFFETKSIPKTINGKEAIVETTFKTIKGIGYDGREFSLGTTKFSERVSFKDMELPKMKETDSGITQSYCQIF